MGFIHAIGTFDVGVSYSTSMYVCMYVCMYGSMAL